MAKKTKNSWSIRFYLFLREMKHQIFWSVFGVSYSCHQKPSCSEYTIEEIKKNGTIIGLVKGFNRVLHCHHY